MLALGVVQGADDAMNDHMHGHVAGGVRLRVEEDFGVVDVVGKRARDISGRHVVEILLGEQHAGAGVIQVEERLQIVEGVGRAYFFHGRIRQLHAVALGQREHQFGFERAFDVDVQFSFGAGGDAFCKGRGDRHGQTDVGTR